MERSGNKAVSPVVGNIFLVAIVVVLGSLLLVLSLTFLEDTGTPTAEASFSYEQTPAGVEMVPNALGTDVNVQLNGEQIASFDANESGRSILIPTAPGDQLTVVSRDEQRSVLVDRTFDDRSEVGDLIAYYPFESGGGNTFEDQSGNGNTGDLINDPTWLSNGIRFDGSTEYAEVTDLSAPVDVDEFTIAVAYNQRDGGTDGEVSQLVEHRFSGNEWYLENQYDSDQDTHQVDYAVEHPNEIISSGNEYEMRERNVAVGTYDGDNYDLFVDGESVAADTHSRQVGMGDMRIGKDFESDIQYFDGDIYEIRLYYTAFEDAEVQRITDAMS